MTNPRIPKKPSSVIEFNFKSRRETPKTTRVIINRSRHCRQKISKLSPSFLICDNFEIFFKASDFQTATLNYSKQANKWLILVTLIGQMNKSLWSFREAKEFLQTFVITKKKYRELSIYSGFTQSAKSAHNLLWRDESKFKAPTYSRRYINLKTKPVNVS